MINLYEILQDILNENVSPSDVVDAIKNKYQVIITYSDDKNRAPKKRLIEPYVYGLSKAGNSVFRAYQYEGDTYRGIPKWKLFRLDRITSWTPTDSHFNAEPKERGWNAASYNENGDNSMSTVLTQIDLHDDISDNPYTKGTDLYKLRNKTNLLKKTNPINISKLKNQEFGPLPSKETNKLEKQNTPNFQKMLDRNLEITKKEKEKIGFTLNNTRGPVNTEKLDNNSEYEKQSTNDFQKMLDRNLEITKKEKEKRGFTLNN